MAVPCSSSRERLLELLQLLRPLSWGHSPHFPGTGSISQPQK